MLYYESIGLLKAPPRTSGNYRSYTEADCARLGQIRAYRDAGLTLEDIRAVLGRPGGDAAAVLKRRLVELSTEIEALRAHQRAIVKLLQNDVSWREKVITKDKWVSIMRASGFTEADMRRWHTEFERLAPEEHREFLQFLHIPASELEGIREWARKGAGEPGTGGGE